PRGLHRGALSLVLCCVIAATCTLAEASLAGNAPPGNTSKPALQVESVSFAGNMAPSVTALPEGGFVVSAISRDGMKAKLHVQTMSPQGRADAPHPVAEGEDWFVNWADF